MTRRSKSWDSTHKKNQVDIRSGKGIDLGRAEDGDKAGDHNRKGGIKINPDVWSEMITVSKFLCLTQEDPDLYDLFDWLRINFFSGQPYGEGLLTRVDSEIVRELGPWNTI